MVAEGDDSVMAPSPGTTSVLLDCINIADSGSATVLAGKEDAAHWIRAGVAQSVAPRETSVKHIRGIGAINRVCMWLKFTLDIGGALVTFHDVPVLSGHRGLLLGNDFLGAGRANLSYETPHSGVLTIRDSSLTPRSIPVPFDISNSDGLSFASEVCSVAGDFGPISPEERQEFAKQQDEAPQVERALRGVDPIGWVPETTVIPSWSEKMIWIRVPETLVKARDVLLLPLEDERRTDPGVLIAPSLARVSKDGYAPCRVINMHKTDKRLPLLTPLVRFQIDPRVYNISYEYTVDEIIEKIHVGTDLNDEERAKVRTMLSTRRALFRSTLGYAHPYKMKLRLRGVEQGLEKPPNATLRVRSRPEEEAIDGEAEKLLKAGLIEPARSPFNSLPMLVEKPTPEGEPKQWRTVLDYRAVNKLLEKDVYPLPNMEMNLSRLGKANWYTICDLLSGFWQVELEDDGISKEATAFSTRDAQYQWVRMPMGLASSPSTFMRLVHAVLNGLPPEICLAYVDDVIIPTCGTFDDHMRDVGMVFDRLIEGGFAVKCNKTHIGLTEVSHLGFMCGKYGTRPLGEKTQAIFDMAIADMWGNPAAAARYSGMLTFYSRFIPDCQQLLAPFSDLKAKHAPTEHIIGRKGSTSTPPSLRFIASFAASRAALANVTALARPDPSKPFEIHIDAASSCGIGAVLMQRDDVEDPDSLRPIAFWSRRLQDEEKGYDVREQECLALDQTLKKWRHYLLGSTVHLLTDHSSLQWLLTTQHPDNSRVAGWALNAQGYDLHIGWIPGHKNVVADCISRSAKSDAPVREMGAAGEHDRSVAERLEDALCSADTQAAGSTQTTHLQHMVDGARDIQRYWRGYSIRSCNIVRVMQPHRSRSSVGDETNIFGDWGGVAATSRMGDPYEPTSNTTVLQFKEIPVRPKEYGGALGLFDSESLPTTSGEPHTVAIPLEGELAIVTASATQAPPAQLRRLSSRVALVLLRRNSSGALEVAIETCEGARVLPSTATLAGDRLCYRGQLSRMLHNMSLPDTILDALPRASSFRARNSSSVARCQFFVQLTPSDTQLYTPDLQFQVLDESLVCSLLEPGDSMFLRLVAREMCDDRDPVLHHGLSSIRTVGRIRQWVGSFTRLRQQLTTVLTYAGISTDPTVVDSIPSIDEKPFGPAFCSTAADGARAISLIDARLRANPGLSLAVDLEGMLGGRRGHIDLMQLAVDAVSDGEEQLVFVFDTNSKDSGFLGQSILRGILQDPMIPKVLHCSYGDCSALYYEYGITIRGVFDTGVADCLLRRAGAHKQRRLDRVLADHVPAAHLSLKGSFKHTPGMFAIRPIPFEYFVYSYEDVVHCNQLFVAMRDALNKEGLLELAWTLSGQRAPPVALPVDDVRHKPPSSVAVVLRDRTHVVCIQHADGLIALPYGRVERDVDIKQQVTRAWEGVLGPLPKSLAKLFNSRMRKAVRVGDTLLVEVVIPDCQLTLSSLRDSAEQFHDWSSSDTVVVRPCCSNVNFSTLAVVEQKDLFQYVWVHNTSNSRPADACVALGKKLTSQRAAIIVHDDKHVLCLTTSKAGELQFPSAPIELGLTARESAIRAFDTYAGPSLNKFRGKMVNNTLMPKSAERVRAGLDAMVEAGSHGNTVFFRARVPALHDLYASFVASRLSINGFRLTATLTNRHPDFTICKHDVAARRLCNYDKEAFTNPQTTVLPDVQATTAAVAQHSGTETTAPTEQEIVDQQQYQQAWTEFLGIQQDEALLEAESNPDSIPNVGDDPEYDALHEAAVLVRYAALVSALDSAADSFPAQHAESVGTPPSVSMPTIAEMRREQRAHPALRPLVDYLEGGEWAESYQQACEEDRLQLVKEAAQHFLDSWGVLRIAPRGKAPSTPESDAGSHTASGTNGLVVVPPSLRSRVIYQYHDRMGHFGINKTLKLLSLRFDWGGANIMRHDIAKHVRCCHPCQMAKAPGHKAGEYQIGDNGQHPNDILCADLYHVGVEEDGYDTTLDFACYFSRAITSIPLKGIPDSETVVDALLSNIISVMGVPSEIRSDQGSNLISKAVQVLYERMAIKMKVGTAYAHQLVALVERWHRTLGQLIKTHRAAVSKASWGSKWYRCLPLMVLAYNATINASTGYSPFFLQHLRHARLPSDYQRAELPELPKDLPSWVQQRLDDLNVVYDAATRSLRLNALSAKRRYDLRRDVVTWFKPGDRVLMIKGEAFDSGAVKAKAALPNEGPFTVLKALPHDRYMFSDLKTRKFRDTVHVSRLIPYFSAEPETSSRWMVGDSPMDQVGGGQWPVQSLVGRRVRTLEKRDNALGLPAGAQVVEYKIRWVGFLQSHDRWRPIQYLSGIFELVNEYDRHNPFSPSDMVDTPSEVVDRPDDAVPGPTSEAYARKHYRAHANKGPPPDPSTRAGPTSEPKRVSQLTTQSQHCVESPEELRAKLDSSLAQLPVGVRVRVHFPKEDSWYTGTVRKSWLPRWRVATKQPAHHVWVEYDDPHSETCEHNVHESIIEVLHLPPLDKPADLAPMDVDGKQRARLLRLKRQLS